MVTPLILAGRYRLDEPIRRDGGGHTWRGVDLVLNRPVAVRMVPPADGKDPAQAVEEFLTRERATAQVVSPFLVSIYDMGSADGTVYLVTELLAGPDLAGLVAARGPLDWDEALRIAARVSTGLADAHAAGLVHGDLRPEHVVFSGDVPKIVAFGARDRGAGRPSTETDDLIALGRLLRFLAAGPGGLPRADTPDDVLVLIARLEGGDAGVRPTARETAWQLRQLREAVWITAQQPAVAERHPQGAVPTPVRGTSGWLPWAVTCVVAFAAAVVGFLLVDQLGLLPHP